MPDDSVVQGEVEALTRRVETVEERVETLRIQTSGNFATLVEGQAALRREMRDGFARVNSRLDGVETRLDRLETKVDEFGNRLGSIEQNQTQIVDLLTRLVGRDPDGR